MRPSKTSIIVGIAAGILLAISLYGSTGAQAGVTPEAKIFEAEFDRAVDIILAHNGQLSPKDQCHRHRKANERHWHLKGTTKRGGPCVKVDGVNFKPRNNAICVKARRMLSEAENEWRGDYRAAARALKECIQGLDAK